MKQKIIKIYYLIIPFLILGISFGYTSFEVSIAALIPLFFVTSRHTVGFFLVMYGGPLGGVVRTLYPMLPIYGIILEFLGFVILWDLILDLFKNNLQSLVGMLFVIAFLGVFYYIGPMDGYSNDKYLKMSIHGFLMVGGYYALDRSHKIDSEGLARLLLVAALSMYAFSINYYKMNPGNLFDYNWFREQYMQWFYSNKGDHSLIDYQHIGMLIAFATAIALSKCPLKINTAFFYVLCASQLVLISGCRQAIFAVAVVLGLRYAIFSEKNIAKKMSFSRIIGVTLALTVAFFIIILFLENSGSTVVSDTLSGGDNARTMMYLSALSIFQNNMMTGVGIGGYNAITGDGYPHNMFFELLCETGVIGTLTLLLIVFFTLSKKRIGLLHLTRSDIFFFLVIITIFIRVMVSSDLTESIEIFSAIFAVRLTKKNHIYNSTIIL